MKILGIETSTTWASVGLLEDQYPVAEFSLQSAFEKSLPNKQKSSGSTISNGGITASNKELNSNLAKEKDLSLTVNLKIDAFKNPLRSRQLAGRRSHSKHLIPLIDSLLSQVGWSLEILDLVAVSSGPGSFTGLRIGMVTATGLAHSCNIPLVTVSTLDVLACNFRYFHEGLICPALDGRKNEIFCSLYQNTANACDATALPERLQDYKNLTLDLFIDWLSKQPEKILIGGDAILRYGDQIAEKLPDKVFFSDPLEYFPHGTYTALLGWRVWLKENKDEKFKLNPIYVRAPEAILNWNKRNLT